MPAVSTRTAAKSYLQWHGHQRCRGICGTHSVHCQRADHSSRQPRPPARHQFRLGPQYIALFTSRRIYAATVTERAHKVARTTRAWYDTSGRQRCHKGQLIIVSSQLVQQIVSHHRNISRIAALTSRRRGTKTNWRCTVLVPWLGAYFAQPTTFIRVSPPRGSAPALVPGYRGIP